MTVPDALKFSSICARKNVIVEAGAVNGSMGAMLVVSADKTALTMPESPG